MADKLSKFNIKGTLADVIDREARSEIESQSESLSEMQSEIDSLSDAYSEMASKVDDITSGLLGKQNILTKWGNFTGNIDELYADSGDTYQNNGVYFCGVDSVTGTLPFTTPVSFFTLIVLKNIQIAFPYITPASNTSVATVKFRDHTNGWRLWRGASFTV